MRTVQILCAALLVSCTSPNAMKGDDAPEVDGGIDETRSDGDVDAGIDVSADAEPEVDDSVCDATSTAPAISAPNEEWTWVPLPGMKCADGSATGVAVNLTDKSDQVLVFFQGGGACWDGFTCYFLKTAAHIEGGYGAAHFQSELAQMASSFLFQRNNPDNPLRNVSWIYVPYCTGDLHTGDRVATHDFFGPRVTHHVGSINADIVINHAAATRPKSNPVWVMGLSAGGYGVGFNVAKARERWSCSNIRGLADCSPLVPIEWQRYGTMQTQWSMNFPAACTNCNTNLGTMPAALRTEAKPGDRYGLLAYTRDSVISIVLGIDGDTLRNQTLAEQAAMAGSTSQAAFVLEGTEHVMLGNAQNLATSNGTQLMTWIHQWASMDPAWANAGP
jgi:hypothetical protein